MKRTPLRKVSRQRAGRNALYTKLRIEFLEANKVCKLSGALPYCEFWACDVHHKDGREGKLLTDVENFIGLCRPCHDWVHQNPNLARERGVLK